MKPTTWVKVFGWIFAILGVVVNAFTSFIGFATYFDEEVELFSGSFYLFFWWALVVEDVCLAFLAFTDVCGGLGRAHVAATGLFVYSTTQLQATAWVMTDMKEPFGVDHATYVGFAFLFVANLLLVTAMGLEHYAKPKRSDDEAWIAMDQEMGASQLVPASDPRCKSVLEVIRKRLVLPVACVGVAGIVAALGANARQECELACVRNWWIGCVQLLGFALFIIFEVILKAPCFRLVLTVILATQVRMLEWIAIGPPGGGSDSVHGVQKAGVIIAIAVSYLLLLSLFRTSANEPPSGGKKTLFWVAVPTAAALVGVILKYQDLSMALPDFVYSPVWQIAMYLLAFIWIIVSCIDKVPILLNFRLPLVAFIAITIQWDSVLFYAFIDYQNLLDYSNWSWDFLEDFSEEKSTLLFSPLVLTFSFLMVMIVMGTSWKGSIESKSRPNGNLASQGTAGNYLRGDKALPKRFRIW